MTSVAYGSPVTDAPPDPDDLLTAREVAELLSRSTEHVRTLFYSNAIPSTVNPTDRNYRARRGDVDAYLAGRLVVDPNPMFVELGDLERQIQEAARRRDELIEQRNRALVHWVDERNQSVTAAAKAAHLSRDRASTLLQLTRAKLRKSPKS